MHLALVTLATIALLNSPLIDPWRLSVASQLERLDALQISADDDALIYLRFDSGKPGYAALQHLLTAPEIAGSPERIAVVQQALDRPHRWSQAHAESKLPPPNPAASSTEQLLGHLKLAPNAVAPEDWLQWLLTYDRFSECLTSLGNCVVLSIDLDQDGQDEQLLCSPPKAKSPLIYCAVSAADSKGWRRIGTYAMPEHDGKVLQALQAGKFELAPSRWQDLLVDGERSNFF